MYPDFGVGLARVLFESTAREIITATESLVTGALQQWLGDLIAVRDVRIDVVETAVTVDVAYELIATRELRRERFAR
jgi:phage baseplate assembly protein W